MKPFKYLICLSFLIFISGSPAYAWKFAAYGDSRPGNNYDHSQNIYGILYKIPNASRITVINSGDLSVDGIDSQWQTFRSIISPLGIPTDNSSWLNAGMLKYISALGNHETHQTGWQTRWQTYLPAQNNITAYSDIPGNAQGLYGSIKYNNALFMWLDFYSLQSSQETFIQNTLVRAKSDPSVMWKFVIFHRPPVSCGGTHSDWSKGKTWHDSYFYANGVDIIFLGDNHYYERTCPFKNGLAASGTSEQNVCDPNNSFYPLTGTLKINPTLNYSADGTHGIMHLVVGNGGAETAGYAPTTQCPWLESDYHVGPKHGFVELEINNNILHAIAWDTDTNIGTTPTLTSTQVAGLVKLDEFTIIHNSIAPSPTPTPSPSPNPSHSPSPSISPLPSPSASPAAKPGDANGDSKVDGIDYVIWLNHYGQTIAGVTNGNFNGDAKVDGIDYVIWLNNFGK